VWVDTFGSDETNVSDRDAGNGITVDESGNVLVTGTFSGKIDFDPGPAKQIIKSNDRTDAFLVELSPKGKRIFIKTFGGDDFDGGVKVAARNGAIYTASYFAGEIEITVGKKTQTLVSAGDDRHTDVLISKYSSSAP
jgi:hypothetical protein